MKEQRIYFVPKKYERVIRTFHIPLSLRDERVIRTLALVEGNIASVEFYNTHALELQSLWSEHFGFIILAEDLVC